MAENRNTINIKSDESGESKVADEVVAIIAGLAATEVGSKLHGRQYHKRDCQQARYEESLKGNSD